MESRNDILNELMLISPLVAKINHATPYQAPEGYFNQLEGQIMQRLNSIENTKLDPQLAVSNINMYQVPEGYFDGLAASILNRIKAAETNDVTEELELLSPSLLGLNKTNPFAVPTGYFNELAGNVVAGVQAIEFVNEELENLAPWLTELKQKKVYQVPQGYFDNLSDLILEKAKHQPAKVVAISFTKRVIRYAAAAIVIGVMAVGPWMYNRPVNTGEEPTVTKVKEFAKSMSDEDIQNFVVNSSASLADNNTVSVPGEVTEADTKVLFADVSDDELQQYLQEHGGATTVNNN